MRRLFDAVTATAQRKTAHMVGDSAAVLRKLMCNWYVATPPKMQLEIARLRYKRVPESTTFVQVQLCLEDGHYGGGFLYIFPQVCYNL